MLEAIIQDLYKFGKYKSVQLDSKDDEHYHFSVVESDGEQVSIRVTIDDEVGYDDWMIEEQRNGEISWDVIR